MVIKTVRIMDKHNPGISSNPEKPIEDHIMVCLSSAVSNAKVIRSAASLAEKLSAPLTALFVETADTAERLIKNQQTLRDNMNLAEQLGAKITTIYGDDVPAQIAGYAQESRITKIVMGRGAQACKWQVRPGVVDRLTALAPNQDIFIVPDTETSRKSIFRSLKPERVSVVDVLKSCVVLTLCTLIGHLLVALGFRDANVMSIYILGAVLNALLTSHIIFDVAYSVTSVLLFNFFFTVPRFSLNYHGTGGPITFLVMLTVAMVVGSMVHKERTQMRQNARKAYRTEIMLDTGHKLQHAQDEESILGETARQLTKLLNTSIVIYPASGDALLEPSVYVFMGEAAHQSAYTSGHDRAAAQQTRVSGKPAGGTTDTIPEANCLYMPVRGGNQVMAVFGISVDKDSPPSPFEKSLAAAMLNECGLALEKERMGEARKHAEMQMEQEQLRANLLRMISHDLRTPLTSISGNAEILLHDDNALSEELTRQLHLNIYEDAIWLNELVENLLSIARIEKTVGLHLQPELLDDVFDESLRHLNRDSVKHIIETKLSGDLLMARMDSRLIVLVIINLINNAIKYTPDGSHITLSARREGDTVMVEVADDGPGIPDESKERIFDLFYIADNKTGDSRRGLGLGLYLCRAIAEAHGGGITVTDNNPKGTVFSFTLQAEEATADEQTYDTYR